MTVAPELAELRSCVSLQEHQRNYGSLTVPRLTAGMINAINDACIERGDDADNRLALIEECQSLPPAEQADILDHFTQVARIWRRANRGQHP